ncbi:peptidase U32 family protein [Anaerovorax odorimutans]|uniref:peptidase U32 family protein n=1 Tax=Anaerovorax odorimutans TaxID=109327 RepID=UPI0004049504|nr:U32 family peptidase [Anaerovorax odorimutans]
MSALLYAAKLYDYGIDALILQDLGLANLIKKFISEFEMHLSIQGTVYNLQGVKVAKNLGFSRVVLARELFFKRNRINYKRKNCGN